MSDMLIKKIKSLRAINAELVEGGQFLLDRLAEMEVTEDIAREWLGHIEPAFERFRAAIAKAKAKGAKP